MDCQVRNCVSNTNTPTAVLKWEHTLIGSCGRVTRHTIQKLDISVPLYTVQLPSAVNHSLMKAVANHLI